MPSAIGHAGPTSPFDVGNLGQLFVDRVLVREARGIAFTLHPAQKHKWAAEFLDANPDERIPREQSDLVSELRPPTSIHLTPSRPRLSPTFGGRRRWPWTARAGFRGGNGPASDTGGPDGVDFSVLAFPTVHLSGVDKPWRFVHQISPPLIYGELGTRRIVYLHRI